MKHIYPARSFTTGQSLDLYLMHCALRRRPRRFFAASRLVQSSFRRSNNDFRRLPCALGLLRRRRTLGRPWSSC